MKASLAVTLTENKRAVQRLLQVLDAMPPINCTPCPIEEALGAEPIIVREHRGTGNGKTKDHRAAPLKDEESKQNENA